MSEVRDSKGRTLKASASQGWQAPGLQVLGLPLVQDQGVVEVCPWCLVCKLPLISVQKEEVHRMAEALMQMK